MRRDVGFGGGGKEGSNCIDVRQTNFIDYPLGFEEDGTEARER